MSKVDDLIDAMFMQGLPANSYKDIANKLGTSECRVTMALNELRANSTKYGWIVPHVKRGQHLDTETGRFYAVLLQPNGTIEYDHASQGVHLSRGLRSTVSLLASQSHTEAVALRAAAEFSKEPVVIRMLERMAGQLDVLENQAHALLATMAV